MKFIHTADWQIGARFSRFGKNALRLQEQRVRTLRRSLEYARNAAVDGYLVAGDLFEDNQIEPALVRQVFELFAEFDEVPVFILPGNHDPFTGPTSIWGRAPFIKPPAHVKVFTCAEAVRMGEGWLLANPLTQKRSTVDPSIQLEGLATAVAADGIRIGMTHGSLAIEARHQPDDFPIAINAASRAGLDYLAVGHWHSVLMLDDDRLVMPGTPEPTDVSETGAGFIYSVEVAAHEAKPVIKPVKMAGYQWRAETIDLSDPLQSAAHLQRIAGCTEEEKACTVLKVTLTGDTEPERLASVLQELEACLAGYVASELRDESRLQISHATLAEIQRDHPLLAGVLEDLDGLEALLSEEGPVSATHPARRISTAELVAICGRLGCEPLELTPDVVATARRVFLSTLQEVRQPC